MSNDCSRLRKLPEFQSMIKGCEKEHASKDPASILSSLAGVQPIKEDVWLNLLKRLRGRYIQFHCKR